MSCSKLYDMLNEETKILVSEHSGEGEETMQDISVLYLSKVTWLPGMSNVVHTHEYWHFGLSLNGETEDMMGRRKQGGDASCFPPGVPHSGSISRVANDSINVMFFVRDKKLAKQLESFPFRQLKQEQLFIPMMEELLEQTRTIAPSQEFVNSAFSHYLRLVMETNRAVVGQEPEPVTLADRCLAYIEENYMRQLRMEEIAEHLDRTPNYISSLVSGTTGMTVVEHMNTVRIKHACTMLAYGSAPLEEVYVKCGFTNVKTFTRVFKNVMGTTPSRYRTSHAVDDMRYLGDLSELDVPYDRPVFTYIPGARKCVNWRTPLEYISQAVKE